VAGVVIHLIEKATTTMDTVLPPQPPPNAPPPPPGPEAVKSRLTMNRIIVTGIGSIVVLVLMGFLAPVFLKSAKASPRTEAINNIKQIGLALQEFDSTYGCFPDASTAARVKEDTKTPLTLGTTSSNQLFRQLLATGWKSEKPFYAKRKGSHRPDDLFADDAHALAPGECSFAYIAGLSSSMDPDTPVAMTPMIPGTTRFDATIYGDRAVILKVDNSAFTLPIDSAGHARLNGMDVFDPRQTFWHGKAPDIKWPE
jgi:type II secretory pathway pseudopilin PulG